ncbi:hypothetical protein Tco_0005730 [Tanacetum coccineum]
MQNLGDISNPKTAFNMALTLMAKAFTLNDTTPTNNNQRSSSNSRNMWIAQPGMNMDQDRQMLMIEDTVGNQFRPNAMHNIRNQVVLNASQNPSVQNVGNQNGLSVVLEIANQYGNGKMLLQDTAEGKKDAAYLQTQLQIAQKDEAGIQINSKEFDFMAAAGAYDEIEKVTANYGSAEKALDLEIERLLREVVSQDIMSIVQNNSVVDASNLQTELDRTKENLKIELLKGKRITSVLEIKRLQAQLVDQKGKSKDTLCLSDTLDPLPQKLENENVELEFQIRNYEKENAHLKAVYKNLFDYINVT